MRVALVHDWLVAMRGGERVLEAICDLYPDADLFTLLHRPGAVSPKLESRRIQTSFLQRIPGIFERYRHFLPLFPTAIESFDLSEYELVISSSHCVAKGVKTRPGATHVSYIHSPMRYMWDLFESYFGPGRMSRSTRLAARLVRPFLQRWDSNTASRATKLIANSRHIAAKVEKFWGRPAEVVYPPVDVRRFSTGSGPVDEPYYLWVGALVPYKRADLAIETFRRLGRTLWMVGSGPEGKRLASTAPSNVRMLGHVDDQQLPRLYAGARALIFPGEEDFGLVPLESLAAGTPVIAFNGGGIRETLTQETAIFFDDPSVDALADAVARFEAREFQFDSEAARFQAAKFDRARFNRAFTDQVASALTRASRDSQESVTIKPKSSS